MFRHCIILAAGEGTRLMPLTQNIPKALIEVDEQPIIFHTIAQVRPVIENLIVTVGHIGHELASYVIKEGATMIIKTHMRGNAFWLFHSLVKNLNEPVLVLTCDNMVNLDFEWLEQEYSRLSYPACLLIPVNVVDGISGDLIKGRNNLVKDLCPSQFKQEQSGIYCSGIQIINPHAVNKLCEQAEDFYEVWHSLIKKRKLLYSNIYPHRWFSINTAKQLDEYYKQSKKHSVTLHYDNI